MEIDKNINNSVNLEPYLHWQQRPKDVQDRIDCVFKALSAQNKSNWGAFNGFDSYTIANINDRSLIKQIIEDGVNEGQIEFYFLEIGAGNFQWEVSIASFINSQIDLAPHIKVHIFGVRGEGGEEKIEEFKNCTVYKLTAFKVENLFEEFQARGYFLGKKFDCIISTWCLRHLVDPLGTFIQVFDDLLAPKKGFFIFDGFNMIDKDTSISNFKKSFQPYSNLMTMLFQTKAPFLLKKENFAGCRWQFLMKKADDQPCQLKMSYQRVEDYNNSHVGSNSITRFDLNGKRFEAEFLQRKPGSYIIYGNDNELYNWVEKNNLFDNWQQLVFEKLKEKYTVEDTI